MDEPREVSPWLWLRVALVGFVLAWILGPSELRDAVPIVVVFLLALGLEVHFLVSALRGGPRRAPDRLPQRVDRERYGFDPDDEVPADEEADSDEDEWGAAAEVAEEEPPPPGARPVRRFAVGLALIVVLGLVIWLVESRTGWGSLSGETKQQAVARFSDEASRVAGKPVDVRCDEARDYVGAVQHADGVAVVGGDLAIVTPEICHDLYRLAFEGEATGSRTGRALAVLAHEAWHLRGIADEGVTECYALQSGVDVGERLGLSEGRARQLMRQQQTENALRGPGGFEYRIPPECRNGGELDLAPSDAEFP
jgi:hypothetical protein